MYIILSIHFIWISMARHKKTGDLNLWLDACTWWMFWFIHNLRRIMQSNHNPFGYTIGEQSYLLGKLLDWKAFDQAWSCLHNRGSPRILLTRCSLGFISHYILGSRSILSQPFNSWLHVSYGIYSFIHFNHDSIRSADFVIAFVIVSWCHISFSN